MAYLIEQLFGWLLIVGALCALSGWAFHMVRSNARVDQLERDRDRLRAELVSLASDHLPFGDGPRTIEADREMDMLRTRAEIASARVTELERLQAQLREQREQDLGRIAELERGLAERPQTMAALPAPTEDTGAEARRWRLRYFEARVRYLEGQLAQAGGADPAALAHAEAQAALIPELKARIAALEARPAADADAAALEHERLRLSWRARYLEARVAYLEGQDRAALRPVAVAAPAPTLDPAEEEARRRAGWRMRYLEARVAHLEGGRSPVLDTGDLEAARAEAAAAKANAEAAMSLAADAEAELSAARAEAAAAGALRARIGELEADLAAARAPDPAAAKARWRMRYLDARVRHLEAERAALAAAPPPAPVAPQPAAAPVPVADDRLVPPGAEVRPIALGAPRSGVPDDLRLIDGVGPKVESTLNSLGVYHFDQIAAWTPANIAWVDQYLRFRGRSVRERWVEQAAALATGAERPAVLAEPL